MSPLPLPDSSPASGRASLLALATAVLLSACAPVQGVRTPQPRDIGTERPVREARPPRPAVETRPGEAESRPFREIRGVWVVRTSLTSPEAVRRMVAETHAAGFNTLLVQVRGRADAYYSSLFEPRPVQLAGAPEGFDPLALVVEEAHARGMEVHAWVVAQLVWGLAPLPEEPDHLVNLHPDWLAVPEALAPELYGMNPFDPRYRARLHQWAVENEGRVEGLFASPAHPEARARLADVVDDLLRGYRLDGIHLDYIRFPSPAFDYSRRTLQEFAAWARTRVPPGRASSMDARVATGDVTAWPREHRDLWDLYREEQVSLTLQAVREVVDGGTRGTVLSAAVFADPMDALRGRFQNWPQWLRAGWVDAVAPMAYTSDDALFADLMEAARRADQAAGGRRIWAGVGIYQTDLEGAALRLGLAREAGAGGFVLFSYDWAATEGAAQVGGSYLDALSRRSFSGGR